MSQKEFLKAMDSLTTLSQDLQDLWKFKIEILPSECVDMVEKM
jgi:hypothetical protein